MRSSDWSSDVCSSDLGADELVFYDIGASPDGRSVDPVWIERVARAIDIPFCVAGGIADVASARRVLQAGADQVSVTTPAIERPALIGELPDAFGLQCVVVGIDSQSHPAGGWRCRAPPGGQERARTPSPG